MCRRSNERLVDTFIKETIMTTTMNNGSTQRKQLSSQLDRLDTILDLAEDEATALARI